MRQVKVLLGHSPYLGTFSTDSFPGLFLPKIKSYKWDSKLDVSLQREKHNIIKQLNSAAQVTVPRYVGDYSSTYRLLAFTDVNNKFYGTVVCLQECETGNFPFIMSTTRLIPSDITRSFPVLELLFLASGMEAVHNVKVEFSGTFCPVNIVDIKAYSDSTIALNWFNRKLWNSIHSKKKVLL